MFFKKFSKKQKKLKENIINQKELKIVLGSGNTSYEGWITTDVPEFDITNSLHWEYFFTKGSISNLLAEHVFEHLTFHQIQKSLELISLYLKKGGVCRIAIPDANHPSKYVYNLTKPGGIEPGADDHKIFFDIEIVSRLARILNFNLRLIEYFDEDGFFNSVEYDFKNGYIKRCSKNYEGRFTNSKDELDKFYSSIPSKNLEHLKSLGITYTSLLFEYIKK